MKQVAELKGTIGELRRELASASAAALKATAATSAELAAAKAHFDKQLAEQSNVFEAHKRNLTEMVKELINELAEEKKKIAGVQIELDRMRKLTTTV